VEDVLSTRVLVASSRREDLVAAWGVIRDSFGSHDVPSTLIGVTVLGYQDQLVEIERSPQSWIREPTPAFRSWCRAIVDGSGF
jgi:hypothetical protein